ARCDRCVIGHNFMATGAGNVCRSTPTSKTAMFVSDRLIYLQMQKTASTHVARVLAEVVGGEQHQQHIRLRVEPEGRLVAISIRSPWDWYVSLWAYGCREGGGRSGVFQR